MYVIETKLPVRGALDSRQGGRPENQDDCGYVDTPYGFLAVVCDGMGGGPGGKTASYIAKTEIMRTFIETEVGTKTTRELLEQSIKNACEAVLQKTVDVPALKGMGSTAVILLFNDKSAYICHVGDSRCYQLRRNKMVFRTNDHSMVGQLVRAGRLTEEQARLSAQSNVITQAIGGSGKVEPEIDVVPYKEGDRFVLCSDGIWGSMPELELVKMFAQKKSLPILAETIAIDVDTIGKNSGGHHDNLTIAIVEPMMNSEVQVDEPFNLKLWAGVAAAVLVLVGVLSLSFGSKSEETNAEPQVVVNDNNADNEKTEAKDENKQDASKASETVNAKSKEELKVKADETSTAKEETSSVETKAEANVTSIDLKVQELKAALDACLVKYDAAKKQKVIDVATELEGCSDSKVAAAAAYIRKWFEGQKGRVPKAEDINILKIKLKL